MRCRHCASDQELVFNDQYGRPLGFTVLAAAFLGIGAVLRYLAMTAWSWVCVGIGAFVLSQALFKWTQSRYAYCRNPKCCRGRYVWPWSATR